MMEIILFMFCDVAPRTMLELNDQKTTSQLK